MILHRKSEREYYGAPLGHFLHLMIRIRHLMENASLHLDNPFTFQSNFDRKPKGKCSGAPLGHYLHIVVKGKNESNAKCSAAHWTNPFKACQNQACAKSKQGKNKGTLKQPSNKTHKAHIPSNAYVHTRTHTHTNTHTHTHWQTDTKARAHALIPHSLAYSSSVLPALTHHLNIKSFEHMETNEESLLAMNRNIYIYIYIYMYMYMYIVGITKQKLQSKTIKERFELQFGEERKEW